MTPPARVQYTATGIIRRSVIKVGLDGLALPDHYLIAVSLADWHHDVGLCATSYYLAVHDTGIPLDQPVPDWAAHMPPGWAVADDFGWDDYDGICWFAGAVPADPSLTLSRLEYQDGMPGPSRCHACLSVIRLDRITDHDETMFMWKAEQDASGPVCDRATDRLHRPRDFEYAPATSSTPPRSSTPTS